MRTAARPAQRLPAITNLKHKTGGQEAPSAAPYLSLRVANPLSHSLLRTHLGKPTTAHVQAGCLGVGIHPHASGLCMYIAVPALSSPGSRWPTRGMYLEIINRIPTRAPDRPVWAYGVLRIQPRPRAATRVQDYQPGFLLGPHPNRRLPTCISGKGPGHH